MSDAPESHDGRCLCGRVSFRAEEPPLWVAHCHCESCRRATASPMTTYAGYRPEAVIWSGDTPASYNSSPGVTRRFCGHCGTPMTYESERWPNEVHLFVATMNDPDTLVPDRHVYAEERIAWMHMADGLPQYDKTAREQTGS
jgi:hypothetical protein